MFYKLILQCIFSRGKGEYTTLWENVLENLPITMWSIYLYFLSGLSGIFVTTTGHYSVCRCTTYYAEHHSGLSEDLKALLELCKLVE